MALVPNNVPTDLDADDVKARFGIAQEGRPTEAQLEEQAVVKQAVTALAIRINENVADSRAKSIALTHLEDALMWAGKAIFQPAGTR